MLDQITAMLGPAEMKMVETKGVAMGIRTRDLLQLSVREQPVGYEPGL